VGAHAQLGSRSEAHPDVCGSAETVSRDLATNIIRFDYGQLSKDGF
jgi:hypothetical protein